ncbi:hypothetical protein VNI00_013672 [Paramarasmius palmivorus]|uniref:Thioesterase domain-containing protein n=1 Tax=Paramarasmius palmivorus TaxID=297713 RepID=A0AAW0BXA5_9AGAR
MSSDQIALASTIKAFHYENRLRGFAVYLLDRLVVEEISRCSGFDGEEDGPGEEGKKQVKVVCSITVDEDMTNNKNTLHGGCAAYLLDMCTSIAVLASQRGASAPGTTTQPGPQIDELPAIDASTSQTISTTYQSPALLGDKLRITSRTLRVGRRSASVRCEIWNLTRRKLCVSGEQVKALFEPQQCEGHEKAKL